MQSNTRIEVENGIHPAGFGWCKSDRSCREITTQRRIQTAFLSVNPGATGRFGNTIVRDSASDR
jgi:hypothetical protein